MRPHQQRQHIDEAGFGERAAVGEMWVLAELHIDLFSRHASLLDVYVFVVGRRKR